MSDKLPEPPKIVLAKVKKKGAKPSWFTQVDTAHGPRFHRPAFHQWCRPEKLTVVEHDRNSPESVEVIKQARKTKCPKT